MLGRHQDRTLLILSPCEPWADGASSLVNPSAYLGAGHVEAVSQADDTQDAGISDSALDAADVGGIETRTFSQSFLREAFFVAHATDISPKGLEDMIPFHAHQWSETWTISLWTMSQVARNDMQAVPAIIAGIRVIRSAALFPRRSLSPPPIHPRPPRDPRFNHGAWKDNRRHEDESGFGATPSATGFRYPGPAT